MRDLNLSSSEQFAATLHDGDAIVLKEGRHTARQLRHHLIFALHHARNINRRTTNVDTVNCKIIARFGKFVRAVEQRLRRNAAHIEASATKDGFTFIVAPSLYDRRIETQLRTLNRTNVTRRPRTNHYYSMSVTHELTLLPKVEAECVTDPQ